MDFFHGTPVWVAVRLKDKSASALVGAASNSWVKGAIEAGSLPEDGAGAPRGRGAPAPPRVRVWFEDGTTDDVPASSVHFRGDVDTAGTEDLTRLDFLHEPGVLAALEGRYGLDLIYTHAQTILIAVNPHKPLPHLYGGAMMAQYHDSTLGEASPHVYAIAEEAFHSMMADGERQAILISGESGAGKTESAKMVMQYLAHRAQAQPPRRARAAPNGLITPRPGLYSSAGSTSMSSSLHGSVALGGLEDEVLQSNPLLEAFGNAKTTRNDNSSRFGKFVQMLFDASGFVTGAHISTFLLERSRVVSVEPGQRSYHIFYQLCAGANDDLRARFKLQGGARSFAYLAASDGVELAGVSDAAELGKTVAAMKVVGLSEAQRQAVLQLVAAVLHLGNVRLAAVDDLQSPPHASQGMEAWPADAAAESALLTAAELLQVPEGTLRRALLTRTLTMRDQAIVKPLEVAAAVASRDALAKTLYAQLFDWVVAAINARISGSKANGNGARTADGLGGGSDSPLTIGILDIYGFESFVENSFEQLCINLANEKLQQQFNAHMLAGQQRMYAQEGIEWSYVDFEDNQVCLDLLEGAKAAPGVFPLIDEACKMTRTTAAALADALRRALKDAPRFRAPPRHPDSFAVAHYAGEVLYSCQLLMEKNLEFVVAEHSALLQQSKLPLMQEIAASVAAATPSTGAQSSFRMESVGSRFRQQLRTLMKQLYECKPHYIRCIKPNAAGTPGVFSPEYSADQLRAGGVLEAVRIASAGFPTRKPFANVAQRYHMLLSGPEGVRARMSYELQPDELRHLAVAVMHAARLAQDSWCLGKTLIFMRPGVLAKLESMRKAVLYRSIVTIQTAWRGLQARLLLRKSIRAATTIQAAIRGHFARREVHKLRRNVAATRIQAAWRMHKHRAAFVALRQERRAVLIQSWWRMAVARRAFVRNSIAVALSQLQAKRAAAATVIQAHVRRINAQRRVKALLAERRRIERLESEVEEANCKAEAATAAASAAEAALATERALVAALRSELASARASLADETAAVAAAAQQDAAAALVAAHAAQLAEAEARAAAADAATRDARARVRALEAQVDSYVDKNVLLALELADATARMVAQQDEAAAARAENADLRQQVSTLRGDAARVMDAHAAALTGLQAQLAQLARAEAAAAGRAAAAEAARAALEDRLAAESAARRRLSMQAADLVARNAALEAAPSPPSSLEPVVPPKLMIPPPALETPRPLSAAAVPRLAVETVAAIEMAQDAIAGDTLHLVANVVNGAVIPAACHPLVATLHTLSDEASRSEMLQATELFLEGAAAAISEADDLQDALLAAAAWCAVCVASGAALLLVHREHSHGAAAAAALLRQAPPAAQLASVAAEALALSGPDHARLHELFRTPPRGYQPPNGGRAGANGRAGWGSVLDGFLTVLNAVAATRAPLPAALLVMAAALRLADAELLNAMLVRRDHCAKSAVKAFSAGLDAFQASLAQALAAALPGASDPDMREFIAEHLSGTLQALQLMGRKADLIRRVRLWGADELGMQLNQICGALNDVQIAKLIEHHHDDLLVTYDSRENQETANLLAAIKKLASSVGGPLEGGSEERQPPLASPATPQPRGAAALRGFASPQARGAAAGGALGRPSPLSRDVVTPPTALRTPVGRGGGGEGARASFDGPRSPGAPSGAHYSTLVRDPLEFAMGYVQSHHLSEACKAYQTALRGAAGAQGFMGVLHTLHRRPGSIRLGVGSMPAVGRV